MLYSSIILITGLSSEVFQVPSKFLAGKEEIMQYLNIIEYYLIQRKYLRNKHFIYWLIYNNINFNVVLTKIDRVSQESLDANLEDTQKWINNVNVSIHQISIRVKHKIINREFLKELPSIPSIVGETLVIKCGSVTISDETLFLTFVHNVVLLMQLGINPVIVHDGNMELTELTDKDTMKIFEMALCGSVNKKIVQRINFTGGSAIAFCGKDGNIVKAENINTTLKEGRSNNIKKILDMGFIGRPIEINPDILHFIEESVFIPVIAPISHGKNGATYHIDADDTASTIAIAVSASK
ncbi:acetylglutamate kinase-like [Calliopsis andreniformis]|uniref:acetylglutamate kinase-like n=1 Tax=Calliopsis andreniformis TaxID=337506 RepID=UPI003FCEA7F9